MGPTIGCWAVGCRGNIDFKATRRSVANPAQHPYLGAGGGGGEQVPVPVSYYATSHLQLE